MKKFILTYFILFGVQAFAFEDYYQNYLQSRLSFEGELIVLEVVDDLKGYQVEFYVSAYGDTRSNWCYFEDSEIVECGDDTWFNKSVR